jgi:hypothetical protein
MVHVGNIRLLWARAPTVGLKILKPPHPLQNRQAILIDRARIAGNAHTAGFDDAIKVFVVATHMRLRTMFTRDITTGAPAGADVMHRMVPRKTMDRRTVKH